MRLVFPLCVHIKCVHKYMYMCTYAYIDLHIMNLSYVFKCVYTCILAPLCDHTHVFASMLICAVKVQDE